VFAIDTSGSVSDSDIDLIFTELEAIASDKSTTVTVVECDSTIHRVYTLRNGRQKVTRQVYGRGGTSFDPTFELIKLGKFGKFTVDDETDLLVYATDGYCTFPTNSLRIKSTKVIWLTTTGMIPAESTWGVTPPGDSRFGMCDYGRYISIK
jgi:predicted metal-dependent peptidase